MKSYEIDIVRTTHHSLKVKASSKAEVEQALLNYRLMHHINEDTQVGETEYPVMEVYECEDEEGFIPTLNSMLPNKA